jgi:hypothetical protein
MKKILKKNEFLPKKPVNETLFTFKKITLANTESFKNMKFKISPWNNQKKDKNENYSRHN